MTDAGPHLNRRAAVTAFAAATIPVATYGALFGEPGNPKRLSVDRRDAEVRAILVKDTRPSPG